MIRILIVDDDRHLRTLIRTYAEAEGFACVEAEDGERALAALAAEPCDLVVLDIMMPGMDGFEVLAKLRGTVDTPVIMLSARKEEYDKLHGFGLGADDYVSKPFSPKELMARVRALLKRSGKAAQEKLSFGALEIFEQSRAAALEGKPLALTPKEFDLLLYMARHNRVAMDRDRLLKNVWGFDYYGDTRTVDSHIKSLRERLGAHRGLVATVWGVGYKFDYDPDEKRENES